MIAEQMLEGSALYPAVDPEMLVTTGRIVSDNLAIGADFTDAYWLGWINFDNLPVDYRLSSFTINGDNITLEDVTEQKNYDIGYTVGNANNPAYKAGVIRYDDENVRWVAWDRQEPDVEAQSLAMRLCNQVDINRQGIIRIVPIFAINPMNAQAVSQSYTMAFCVVDALTFFRNDAWTSEGTIVDLRGSSGISGTVTFSASDIDGTVHTRTLGGVNCEFFCCGFQIENSNWTYYNNETDEYEFTTIQSTLRPFLALEANGLEGKYVVNAASSPFNNGFSTFYGAGYTYNQRYGFLWQYNQSPYVYQTKPFNSTEGLIAGNFTGTFSAASVRERFPSTGVYGFYGVEGGNFILQSTGVYEYVMIRRLYTIDEIRKTMSLYPRIISPGFADYVNYNDTVPSITDPIYARVSDTNEFVTETVSGYRECIFDLRPWQRINYKIQPDIAPYDSADKPPYTPQDQDEQGSNTGSVVRPTTLGVGGTNGFITQYSLTAAQMSEIGELLWLSFINPDYYKNFLFTLTTTGTINLSNLIDYFVSLRVYPFPLINVPSHAAAGQDMWIGAGLVPLHFTNNLHTINNYADYIDVGRCTIPRYYHDFRDMAHTQIMLYLPYCGTVQLNPADVIGSTLHAQYAVDFATGSVTAYVDCTTWDGAQFVIAVLAGSIGADIPLTASNAAQIAARIAGDTLNFAGTVGGAVASDIGRSTEAIGAAAMGNVAGAAIGVAGALAGRVGGALDVAKKGLEIATADGVKMPMLSGGRGFGSFGAPQTAYIQIRRGIYAEGVQTKNAFKSTFGNEYQQPVQVSTCKGFTVFSNVDTSGLQCDATERDAVKKMMQAGIYI